MNGKGSNVRKSNISKFQYDKNAALAGIDTKNESNLNPGRRIYNSKGQELLSKDQFLEGIHSGPKCFECGVKKKLLHAIAIDDMYKTKLLEKGLFVCESCAVKILKLDK